MKFIYQFNSVFSAQRIKICKRFIVKNNVGIVHHYSSERNFLLLSSRQIMRLQVKQCFNFYKFCNFFYLLFHNLCLYFIIFQSKRYIFRNSKPHKLCIRILKNSSHVFRMFKYFLTLFPINLKLSCYFPLVKIRNKSIYTMSQSTFPRA